jgi:transcriptional regulator with XRE-family HTH domain
MSKNLGQLESLARENSDFAAAVAVAEFVRNTATMLKAMRERAGLSQIQLGRKLGLSQGRISQIESGLMDHAANLETIALYAKACAERVTFQASGKEKSGRKSAAEIIVGVYGGEPGFDYAASTFELVTKRGAIRGVLAKRSGITQVKGCTNRFRLSAPLSANVMNVLGLAKR